MLSSPGEEDGSSPAPDGVDACFFIFAREEEDNSYASPRFRRSVRKADRHPRWKASQHVPAA